MDFSDHSENELALLAQRFLMENDYFKANGHTLLAKSLSTFLLEKAPDGEGKISFVMKNQAEPWAFTKIAGLVSFTRPLDILYKSIDSLVNENTERSIHLTVRRITESGSFNDEFYDAYCYFIHGKHVVPLTSEENEVVGLITAAKITVHPAWPWVYDPENIPEVSYI